MKYNLTEIKLRKVADGKRNAGQLFVQFTAENPDDILDGGEVTILNPRFARQFEPYLQISQQGPNDPFGQPTWLPSLLKDQNNPIPDKLLTITHADFELYMFPGDEDYVLIDDNNQPRLNSKGNMIVSRSVLVFTKKKVDNESGQLVGYAPGFSPEEQGRSIMQAYYKPLREFTQTAPQGIALPQDVETQLINSGSTPAAPATPAATPAV